MKSKTRKPVGIYGGEPNGANPPAWSLRDIICAQLRKLGWHCCMDQFSDRSASWIEVYKESPVGKKDGKLLSMSIQFDIAGNIITNIRIFEQEIVTKIGEAKLIF